MRPALDSPTVSRRSSGGRVVVAWVVKGSKHVRTFG